jgi:hypothetical protein
MRLWAEERKQGTIELLLTLPVPLAATVLGKFLAAWAFAGIALVLTFPMWITANYLGNPDNGVIAAAYLGSFLMAGRFPRHRLRRLSPDQEPGYRVRRDRRHLLRVPDQRIPSGNQLLLGLGPAGGG